jgi:hypothetical protein
VLPENIIVGNPACLANGELLANALAPESIENGFNSACFAPQVDDKWMYASAWPSCSMQFFYARILTWLYEGNTTSIGIAFRMLLGNTPTLTYHPGNALLPDVVTVVWPTGAIACVDGTSNFQQLATQAFTVIAPPTNIGLYGTLPLWYAASSWINTCLAEDGADPTAPLMVVGHSYGGAAVANLAARYRAADANRPIMYLTFGTPKPGETRLQALLTDCSGIALADDDDPVPALPPNTLLLWPVASALSLFRLTVWGDWIRIPNQALQASDGTLSFNEEPTLGFGTLLDWAQRALAGTPLPVFPGHAIEEYAARILTRCPFPEWPISRPLWQFLIGQPTAQGGAMGGGGVAGVLPPPTGRGGAAASGATEGALAPAGRGGAAASGNIAYPASPIARGGAAGSGRAVASGGGSSVSIMNLGTLAATGPPVSSVSLNLTVPSGLLVVAAANWNSAFTDSCTATWNGTSLNFTVAEQTQFPCVTLLYLPVSAGSGTLVVEAFLGSLGFTANILAAAFAVTGLVDNTFDQVGANSGNSSSPTGGSLPYSGNEAGFSCVGLTQLSAGSWTWATPFADGGQDQSWSSGSFMAFTIGTFLPSSAGSVAAQLNGVTPTDWCMVTGFFK